MEPTFLATPFAQASSPASRQIRAWLDEREVGYTQWRASRKPVAHAFASAKLNSPLRALPRVATNAASHTPPLWLTLSNQAAEVETTPAKKKPETPNGARTTAPDQVSTATNSVPVESSATALRRSSVSTPTLPTIAKREAAGSHAAAAKKSMRLADLPLVARTRTSALAKKRLQEHLYAFHSRQVFSFARSADEENQAEQHESLAESCEEVAEHNVAPSSTCSTSDSASTSTPPTMPQNRQQQQQQEDDWMLQGLSFVTEEDCARIFDHDWRLSDVERVVRDAVERKRIYEILKRSYRILLWFFRFYAGKSGLAAGSGSANSPPHALFQIADKLKLLEDLNVLCVDPSKFGIADTPLARDGLVGFLLSVARMMSSHGPNPARLRVLVAEGIDVSDAMSTLVRDYFGVFAQIQDANHFRNVFLRRPPRALLKPAAMRSPRRFPDVLDQHMENLRNFFGETAKLGLGATTPATAASDPVDPGAPAPPDDPRLSVTFAQFLSVLRTLGLIANPKPKAASSTQQTTGAPVAIEEGRALRVFLSCLEMSEGEGSDRSATVSTREATFAQFVEALLRVALLRRELVVCRGQYDVCPGELASERCRCGPERAQCDFSAFDDAVEELFGAIHAFRLGQARKRASLKMQLLRSLHHHNTVHKLSGGGA